MIPFADRLAPLVHERNVFVDYCSSRLLRLALHRNLCNSVQRVADEYRSLEIPFPRERGKSGAVEKTEAEYQPVKIGEAKQAVANPPAIDVMLPAKLLIGVDGIAVPVSAAYITMSLSVIVRAGVVNSSPISSSS